MMVFCAKAINHCLFFVFVITKVRLACVSSSDLSSSFTEICVMQWTSATYEFKNVIFTISFLVIIWVSEVSTAFLIIVIRISILLSYLLGRIAKYGSPRLHISDYYRTGTDIGAFSNGYFSYNSCP